MAWVSDDLIIPAVAGVEQTATAVISKVFHVEDPRFLTVTTLAASVAAGEISLETRTGSGTWNAVATGTAVDGDTITFFATDQLLQDQVRVKFTKNVTNRTFSNLWICRKI